MVRTTKLVLPLKSSPSVPIHIYRNPRKAGAFKHKVMSVTLRELPWWIVPLLRCFYEILHLLIFLCDLRDLRGEVIVKYLVSGRFFGVRGWPMHRRANCSGVEISAPQWCAPCSSPRPAHWSPAHLRASDQLLPLPANGDLQRRMPQGVR